MKKEALVFLPKGKSCFTVHQDASHNISAAELLGHSHEQSQDPKLVETVGASYLGRPREPSAASGFDETAGLPFLVFCVTWHQLQIDDWLRGLCFWWVCSVDSRWTSLHQGHICSLFSVSSGQMCPWRTLPEPWSKLYMKDF